MNELLAKLGVRGASAVGGSSDYERFLVVTDSSGLIDASFISGGVVLTPNTQIYYVDGATGNDANNGSIANPLATLAGALTRNIADTASPMIIFIAPGTYAGATITDAAQTDITFIGINPDLVTVSGTIQFNNGSGDNQATLIGVTVTTVSDLNAAGLFDVYLQGRSELTNVSSANGGGGGDVVVLEESTLTNPPTNLTKTGHTFLTNNPHTTTLEQARTAGNTVSGVIDMNSFALTNVPDATAAQHALTYNQFLTFESTFVWQAPVLDRDLTVPPGGPTTGDRYIVGVGASGAWNTFDDSIAEWNGSSWDFISPVAGFMTWADDEAKLLTYTSSWVLFDATLSHNSLADLTTGDPHTQYPLKANDLSDLADAPTARTNLGLGDSATKDVGTGPGDVAAGNILDIAQNRELTTINSNTTLDNTHFTVLGDTTSGTITATLIGIGTATQGRLYVIKNVGTVGNQLLISGDGTDEIENIGSLGSFSGTISLSDGETVILQANDTDDNWYITAVVRNPTANLNALPSWTFINLTADADPGAGNYRLNNAAASSATFIYVSKTANGSVAMGDVLAQLGSGGYVYLHQHTSISSSVVYSVTGAVTDGGTYTKIPVSFISQGSTVLSNNQLCAFTLYFATAGGLTTRTGVYREIYTDAAVMTPRTTNGATPDTEERPTNDVMTAQLLYDPTTEEAAQFKLAMPNAWDGGTVKVKFYWDSTGVGNVVWGVSAASRADDEAIDQAFGTEVTVTDPLLGAGDVHITAATGAVTIGGTIGTSNMVFFQVARKAAAGGDTLTTDAKLLGVAIQYKESPTEPSAW